MWKIKQFGGGKEFLMRAELGLPSVRGDDEKGGGMMGGFGGSMGGAGGVGGKAKRPIQVKFEIPYFTTSGIQVRYLKIIEPKVSGVQHCRGIKLIHYSCNTQVCRGCGILLRVVTSLYGYQTYSDVPRYPKCDQWERLQRGTTRHSIVLSTCIAEQKQHLVFNYDSMKQSMERSTVR